MEATPAVIRPRSKRRTWLRRLLLILMFSILALLTGGLMLSYRWSGGVSFRLGTSNSDFHVVNLDMARGRGRILLEIHAWGSALKAQPGPRFTTRWETIPRRQRSVFADWPSWWINARQSDDGQTRQWSRTFAGIVVERVRAEAPAGRTGFVPYAENKGIAFPLAYLAVIALPLVLLVWRIRRADRRAASIAAGRCPICNYDCRVTPGRCSECGWVKVQADRSVEVSR